jgi:hypothetical protein
VQAARTTPATIKSTAATTPSLRIIGIIAPTVSSAVSRNGTLNDDLTPDCASV